LWGRLTEEGHKNVIKRKSPKPGKEGKNEQEGGGGKVHNKANKAKRGLSNGGSGKKIGVLEGQKEEWKVGPALPLFLVRGRTPRTLAKIPIQSARKLKQPHVRKKAWGPKLSRGKFCDGKWCYDVERGGSQTERGRPQVTPHEGGQVEPFLRGDGDSLCRGEIHGGETKKEICGKGEGGARFQGKEISPNDERGGN